MTNTPKLKPTNASNDVGGKMPYFTVVYNVMHNHYGENSTEIFRDLKIDQPIELAISLLGIFLYKMQSAYERVICTLKFSEAQFTVAKVWSKPRYSSTDAWMKKVQYTHTQWSTIKSQRRLKISGFFFFVTKWI